MLAGTVYRIFRLLSILLYNRQNNSIRLHFQTVEDTLVSDEQKTMPRALAAINRVTLDFYPCYSVYYK
jgi:hypothetical protein